MWAHHPYVIRLPFSMCVVITVEVFGVNMCLFCIFYCRTIYLSGISLSEDPVIQILMEVYTTGG